MGYVIFLSEDTPNRRGRPLCLPEQYRTPSVVPSFGKEGLGVVAVDACGATYKSHKSRADTGVCPYHWLQNIYLWI